MAEPVAVVGPDGTPLLVDAQQAGEVARAGGHVMSKAEEAKTRREVDLKQRLDGAEGVLGPLAAGAARGLTFGLSDAALVGLGGEGARQRLLDYQGYNPIESTGGELMGAAAGALMGEGLLGSVAGGASRLGAAAESGVSRLLGAGAGAVARGGVEGALYGAGGAISESALQNHDLTGEALIASAAHGALGGAAISGVLHGAGSLLSRLRAPSADAYDSLAARTFGEAAPGTGKSLAEAHGPYRSPGVRGLADDAADTYIGNLPGVTPEKRAELADVFANREKSFASRAEVTEKATREFAKDFDEVLAAGRKTDMSTFGDAKKVHTGKLVDAGRIEEQAALVRQYLDEANPIVQALGEDVNSAVTKSDLKQWNGWIKEASAAIEKRDSAALYNTLDDMKRWMGKEAEFGKGPFGLSRSTKEFTKLYQGGAEEATGGLMRLLEHDAWGAQGAAQREINSATERMMAQGNLAKRKFSTQYDSSAGRPLYRADPSSINGFFGRLTSAANDLDAEAAANMITTRRAYLDAVEKNYSQTAAGAKAISQERAALDRMERTLKTTSEDVSRINQVNAALSEERARGIGGAVGAVLDIASKPYTNLQRIAHLEQTTKGVTDRIATGIKGLVGGTGEKAARPGRGLGARAKGFFSSLIDGFPSAMAPAKEAATYAGAAAAGKAAYAKRADQIGTLSASPDVLADRVGKVVQPFTSAAPQSSAAAVSVAGKGIAYLTSVMPPGRQDQYSLQPMLQRPRPSDAEVARFNRTMEALDNPLIVLDEAKNGSLSRDHVEAVKAVYPQIYDQIRSQVFEQLVARKTVLPYQRRIQLGILLDLPTDKTLSPEFISAVQATYGPVQATEAPPTQPNAFPDLASSYQTATQSATEGVQ